MTFHILSDQSRHTIEAFEVVSHRTATGALYRRFYDRTGALVADIAVEPLSRCHLDEVDEEPGGDLRPRSVRTYTRAAIALATAAMVLSLIGCAAADDIHPITGRDQGIPPHVLIWCGALALGFTLSGISYSIGRRSGRDQGYEEGYADGASTMRDHLRPPHLRHQTPRHIPTRPVPTRDPLAHIPH